MRFHSALTLFSAFLVTSTAPLLAYAAPSTVDVSVNLQSLPVPPGSKTVKYVTSSDGLKIYADSNDNYGKPAIVFAHGFKLTGAVFDDLFTNQGFASKYHLVRYDLRGQGRSGVPTTADGHASKLYADDFKAISDAFGVKKPYSAGWSYGGTVLSDVTTYLPSDYLSGSIYLAAVPVLGTVLATVAQPAALDVIPLITSPNETSTVWEAGHANFTELLYSTPENVPITTKWTWRGMMSSAPPVSYALGISRTVDPSALYALGAKGYPLHLIIGDSDQLVDGPALVNVLQPHFTKLSVHYVKGGGHSVFYQNVQETANSIIQFVSANKWTGH